MNEHDGADVPLDPGSPASPGNDAELIQRYRNGDQFAAIELYRQHHPDAVKYGRLLTRNKDLGEDLASEAFTKVLEIIRRGGGPTEKFRPYLRTVLKNSVIEWSKENNLLTSVAEFEDQVDERHDESLFEDEINPPEVVAAFQQLPSRWQHVLYLRVVEEAKISDIARRFDLSSRSMSALYFRAKAGLRKAYLQEVASRGAVGACVGFRGSLVKGSLGQLGSARQAKLDQHLLGCVQCTAAKSRVDHVVARFDKVEAVLAAAILAGIMGVPLAETYFKTLRGRGARAQASVRAVISASPVGSTIGIVAVSALVLGAALVWAQLQGQGGATDPATTSDAKPPVLSTPAPADADCVTTAESDLLGEGETTITVRNHAERPCTVRITGAAGDLLVEAEVTGVQQFVVAREGPNTISVVSEHGSYEQTFG